MQFLFFPALFLCIYSYVIYPPLLAVIAFFVRRKWRAETYYPIVSIVISAFNEAGCIKKKIENAISLDYPPELVEIVVSSDGSTDATNEIVNGFDDSRVKLKAFERSGKTACLNRVVPHLKSDIVVFTDANSMFPTEALLRLTQHFRDENIGLVTGGTVYVDRDGKLEPTGLYARLEKWTKERESAISSCVGADGAIFALRRALYQPLSDGDINDLVIPLRVVRGGNRVVIDSEVRCLEEASGQGRQAFRRQVRISTRTIWAILRNRDLLNIRQYGFFAFFLWSHKLIRLTMPFWFIAALMLNFMLMGESGFYWLTMLAFVLFVGSGIADLNGWVKNRITSLCKLFLVTGAAQFVAWIRVLRGREDVLWTPER